MRSILQAVLATSLVLIGTASARYDTSPYMGCGGVPNDSPVLELPAQPVKTVPNGQSWKMEQDTNFVYIARLSGTPYEMGYAYGQLFGAEIGQNFQNILNYGYTKLQGILSKFGIPDMMIYYIWSQAEPAVMYLLDLNWQIAEPWIPQRFVDELKGIADGSGGAVTEQNIRRANMLPELTQAACSIVGSWGAASQDGKLIHLRALDWEPTAPVNQFPSVIIYEPTEEGSETFANIGYLGLIGSLTAMSKLGISVGEKVFYARAGDYEDPPHITYYGKPWAFHLRDTVQFAKNLDDVERMLFNVNRTMMIHLGYGSLPDKAFRGHDYAANFVMVYDDKNYTHYSQVHPQLEGIFFYDKQVQPSGNPCVGAILNATHGSVTPATMYRDIAGYDETGNAQVIVMDPEAQEIWASWSQFGADINAYQRSPMHIKLHEFWGTPQGAKCGGGFLSA